VAKPSRKQSPGSGLPASPQPATRTDAKTKGPPDSTTKTTAVATTSATGRTVALPAAGAQPAALDYLATPVRPRRQDGFASLSGANKDGEPREVDVLTASEVDPRSGACRSPVARGPYWLRAT
jgi:hypothetical protein